MLCLFFPLSSRYANDDYVVTPISNQTRGQPLTIRLISSYISLPLSSTRKIASLNKQPLHQHPSTVTTATAMAAPVFPPYPPSLEPKQLSYLLGAFTDWSLSHGLAVRPLPSFVAENPNGALATHAPTTLFPSPFPRSCWREAREVQKGFNELYARISADDEWLGGIAEEYVDLPPLFFRSGKIIATVYHPHFGKGS